MSQIMVSTNMPQITVVSMIVEGRLDRLDSFPLLYPLGLMESRSPFPHVQFSQKHLFVSKYSLGTEFLVSPSPLWLLLLRNIPVPGLDWNGAHFQEHAPEHFWSLKTARGKIELCEHGSKIQSAKLHKCIFHLYNLRVKVCNKNLQ